MNRSRGGAEGQPAAPELTTEEKPKAPARRTRSRKAPAADPETAVAETTPVAAPEPVVEAGADPASAEEAPATPRRGRRGLGPRSRARAEDTGIAEPEAASPEPIEQAPEPAASVELDAEPPAGDAQVEEGGAPRRRTRGSRGGANRRGRGGDRPLDREPEREGGPPPRIRSGGPAIRPEMPPRDMVPSRSEIRSPRGESSRAPRGGDVDRPPRRDSVPQSRDGGRSGSVESLIARQNVLFEDFAAQQGETLRQLQRSVRGVGGAQSSTGNLLALPKVAIFLDVPNLIYAAEQIGVRIDFGKLLDYLTEGRQLVRATAYAPITDDPQTRFEAQRFVAPVVNHGYKIVTKPWKRFADGSMKANFDIELAVDILTMSDRLDIVVLLSGDGDFRRVCELVESKGVRVEVVAFAQSSAKELRDVADLYTDLNAILNIVGM